MARKSNLSAGAKDYVAAVGAQTGLILKVWPSNYRVVGFTADVGTAELARLARERGIPLVVDQGCGRLFRDAPGPESEESVDALLEAGAGLVCFSGDKMLGGPQWGVIVGAPDLVSACAKNPLARALRPGKLTLAALGATLRGWMSAEPGDVPVARMLSVGHDDLRAEADALLAEIRRAAPGIDAHVLAAVSRVGGGAAPEEDLPTGSETL